MKLDASSIEVIASSITAAIALLTLWFTSLRGPDLELLNKSEVAYIDQGLVTYRVLSEIGLRGLEFVFTNNGSRTGTITAFHIKLKPEAWFAPYYGGARVEVLGDNSMSPTAQSVSIRSGANKIVRLSCRILTLDWKAHPNKLDPSLPLGEAIHVGLDEKFGQFESFVKALGDNKPLGSLEVTATLTARKWGYKSVLKDRGIAAYTLPPLSAKTKAGFQESVALWADIYPEFQRVVNDAVSEVRRTSGPIKRALEQMIKGPEIAPAALPTNEVDMWLAEVDNSYPQFHALRKGLMMWSKQLDEALPAYRKASTAYNIELDRYNLRKSVGHADVNDLGRALKEALPIVEKALAALDDIEVQLAKAT